MNRMENLSRVFQKQRRKKTQKFSFITQFKSEMLVHKADPLDPARRELDEGPKTIAPMVLKIYKGYNH